MAKYYTSYFSNYSNIPDNYFCVSIARYSPDFFINSPLSSNRMVGDLLAPSEELLHKIKNNEISEDEYTKEYIVELSKSLQSKGYNSFEEYFKKIDEEYNGYFSEKYEGVVFFCYEKPGDFCHRHILAKIMNQYGYNCQEWDDRKKPILNNALF